MRVSQVWHQFLDVPGLAHARHRKHARQLSDLGIGSQPLAKRIAHGITEPRFRRVWSMAEAQAALKQLYGPGARYRSTKQEEAVQAVVRGLTPVVAVLATGEGKSLLYVLPALLPGVGTTVVVVPLIALKQDTVRRCEEMGLHCTIWDYAGGNYDIGSSLIIVSIDKAVQPSFQAQLAGLEAAGRLHSIVFDECHLLLTALHYRSRLAEAKWMRQFSCQQIYLTATLPPCLWRPFLAQLFIKDAAVIRSSTVRRDIKYAVRLCPAPGRGEGVSSDENLMEQALVFIRRTLTRWDVFASDARSRAIVYTRRRDQARQLAQQLGCPAYYSDSGTDEEKAKAMKAWMDGEAQILAATSAFGAGIDYKQVRAVFHVGEPASTVNFAQEVGRGGRDGASSISWVILEHNWRARTRDAAGQLLDFDVKAMQRYLDAPRCRVAVLSEFLDGRLGGCASREHACDRCMQRGPLAAAPAAGREARGGDMAGERYRETDESSAASERYGEDKDAGVVAVEEAIRGAEQLRERFFRKLELVEGRCVLCGLLGDGGWKDEAWKEHRVRSCKRLERDGFYEARKRAGRFMEPYAACWKCGMSLAMCVNGWTSSGECKYNDVAIPVAWLVYHSDKWRTKVENWMGMRWRDEGEYMKWAGRKTQVFEMQASNVFAVLVRVIDEFIDED